MAREKFQRLRQPLTDELARQFSISGVEYDAPPLEQALYLVATPIGNLRDITIRALETLAAVDLIACEDTRVSLKLLKHYGISKPVVAYHEHNSDKIVPKVLDALDRGSVALVSDAGTPLVADPGNRLVSAVLEAGIRVIPIPGASAVITALVSAGLGDEHHYFAGFIPNKTSARLKFFDELKNETATLVLFESPHRLKDCLSDAVSVFGSERKAVVARELTKRFETVYRGTLSELCDAFAEKDIIKGEIVLLIGRAQVEEFIFDLDEALHLALQSSTLKEAVSDVAVQSGLPRREVYQRAIEIKNSGN